MIAVAFCKSLDFFDCLSKHLLGYFTSACNKLFDFFSLIFGQLGVDFFVKTVKFTASYRTDILTGKTASLFYLVLDVFVNVIFNFFAACIGVRIYCLEKTLCFT